ncbi:MAG: type 4a pilus biogenesis protein PilO [Actinobacteria bacterium]|nr:type 4a pilus biogenesis protein PilO [Actinomycetota bacterium]
MSTNVSNRTVLVAAGVVLVLVGLWFLVVSPKRSEASKLESDVAFAQAELVQRKADLAQPSAAVTVRASDVFRLAKALPEDANVAAVMLDVDRLAARHRLTLEGFQPTAVVPVTGYYAQPLTVTVQGRFNSVSRFLGDLRKLVKVKKGRLDVDGRLYSVTEVRLGKPEGDLQYPTVRAGILLNAFGVLAGVPVTPEGAIPPPPSSDGTSAAGATP